MEKNTPILVNPFIVDFTRNGNVLVSFANGLCIVLSKLFIIVSACLSVCL